MPILSRIQLGKAGVTENFLTTLKSHFKNHKDVKISVLSSAGRENIKKYEQQILESLGITYTARTLGFTIAVKKWRKPQR